MATRTLTLMYCDRCDSSDEVEKRFIMVPATRRQKTFDACKTCRDSVPLSEWESLIANSPRATRSRPVVSEAVAAAAGDRPRRKAGARK